MGLLVTLITLASHAQMNPPLDPLYTDLTSPTVDVEVGNKASLKAINIAEHIQFQTPVKSQGRRGTCSIFSATALTESLPYDTRDWTKNPALLFQVRTSLVEKDPEFLAARDEALVNKAMLTCQSVYGL